MRLREFGLTARPSKTRVGFTKFEFLGHIISVGTIMAEQTKVENILVVKQTINKRQVCSILGQFAYYRRYVPHFASITAPLTDFTKGDKSKRIQWTAECQRALENIQKILNSVPVLLLPSIAEDFVLRTDASARGMGAVMLQRKGNILHPTQYTSKKCSQTQQRYSTIERECLAIIWGCEKFARYLVGTEFILQTDHRLLTFLQASKTKNNRLQRWALSLQEFRFRIEPIPGNTNIFADLLSHE